MCLLHHIEQIQGLPSHAKNRSDGEDINLAIAIRLTFVRTLGENEEAMNLPL